MARDTREPATLTRKGELTRARIVETAARLIHSQGVAGTTLEDVRQQAGVSGSQLTHYFANKDELVQSVIDHQADVIVGSQRRIDLSGIGELHAWRENLIAYARRNHAEGGCPLGSLAGQVAETDPRARALLAAGFERWSAAISDGLRTSGTTEGLPAGIDNDDLAITLLATIQGGLLLAQVQRDSTPLQTAVDTVLALVADRNSG